jgi:hypothetical protein
MHAENTRKVSAVDQIGLSKQHKEQWSFGLSSDLVRVGIRHQKCKCEFGQHLKIGSLLFSELKTMVLTLKNFREQICVYIQIVSYRCANFNTKKIIIQPTQKTISNNVSKLKNKRSSPF